MMAEWSAAIAAGAFVVFVAGALIGIRVLLVRLARAQASVEAIQADMHKLSAHISDVLKPLEDTVQTARRGLQSTESLFQAAGGIGSAVETTTAAVERVASVWSAAAIKHSEEIARKRQVGEAAEWAELGLTAWYLWQARRGGKPPKGDA